MKNEYIALKIVSRTLHNFLVVEEDTNIYSYS